MFTSISLPMKKHFIHWDFAFIFGTEFLTVDCKNKKKIWFYLKLKWLLFFLTVKQHADRSTQMPSAIRQIKQSSSLHLFKLTALSVYTDT